MDPQNLPFLEEPESEEPPEAVDYYDAIRMGELSSDAREDLGEETIPGEPRRE